MAEQRLRPVIGRKKVPAKGTLSHTDGWNGAVENALKKQKFGWPPGTYKDVTVEFRATVEVYNPGSIVEYSVAFMPPHGHGGS